MQISSNSRSTSLNLSQNVCRSRKTVIILVRLCADEAKVYTGRRPSTSTVSVILSTWQSPGCSSDKSAGYGRSSIHRLQGSAVCYACKAEGGW